MLLKYLKYIYFRYLLKFLTIKQQTQKNNYLLLLSVDLPFLGTSYKGDDNECSVFSAFILLAHLQPMILRFILGSEYRYNKMCFFLNPFSLYILLPPSILKSNTFSIFILVILSSYLWHMRFTFTVAICYLYTKQLNFFYLPVPSCFPFPFSISFLNHFPFARDNLASFQVFFILLFDYTLIC